MCPDQFQYCYGPVYAVGLPFLFLLNENVYFSHSCISLLACHNKVPHNAWLKQ